MLQKLMGRMFLASFKNLYPGCFSNVTKAYGSNVSRLFLKIYTQDVSQMLQKLMGRMFLASFKNLYPGCFSNVTKAYESNVSQML
jgi:hypothetical protein